MTPEEQRAYHREYYQKHKEAISKQKKARYEANKEQILKKNKEWNEANKERCREYNRKCKERKAREETCKILKEHKQALADDPERLSTDFILKLVLGEDA